MKPPAAVPVTPAVPIRVTPGRDGAHRLHWGLSARLPRWRAFDGRRSRVALNPDAKER